MIPGKVLVLSVFLVCYVLALSRRFKLAYVSLGASFFLLVTGLISLPDVIFQAIQWDVLGIYWGFMMVSYVFMKSGTPELIADRILMTVKVEKYAIFSLCLLTAFLSSFMENVGVVLMMAPVAITLAKKMESSLFPYLVAVAVSSNVVTTVTMIGDPPAIILAMETGMKFFDFYWFQGKPGLGTVTLFGVAAAMAVLFIQFRHMDRRVHLSFNRVETTRGPLVLFLASVLALAAGPEIGIRPGFIGLAVGFIALGIGRRHYREMLVEFDWNSFFFIVGIFIVIFSVKSVGILDDLTHTAVRTGFETPAFVLAFLTWISVICSAFMDNVPFTVLMIPICQEWARLIHESAWPFLYGMLIGTGAGGNITPVAAAANVFACGILEKEGYKIRLTEFMKIGLPFSIAAVAVSHLLLHFIWLS